MSEKKDTEKKEVEYPRWVYPPDGGPGCIIQTPDDRPKGWLDGPVAPGPATGERVIGTPDRPAPALDQTPGLTPDERKEVDTLERKVQEEEDADEATRKSKRK